MYSLKKLIKVEAQANNNKYYEMHPKDDGTFLVKFGRVEGGCQEATYPISRWDSKYREKLRKGYKDVTEIIAEFKQDHNIFSSIKDTSVRDLISELQNYSNTSIKANYSISANSVTQKQVDEAQRILNEIYSIRYIGKNSIDNTNKKLEELFTIIPRKMKRVSDHLIEKSLNHNEFQKALDKKVADEQATLDVMAGQVSVNTKSKSNTSTNILEVMGLEVTSKISDKELDLIKKLLGPNAHQFRKAYKVINKNTQENFDKHLNSVDNKHRKLFWHGSRNENWWSILGTGLVLRPTNAVITGKMFGYGIYFADKAQKSIGYTSLSGSYWARGNSRTAFLSLFDVHLGNYYHTKRQESFMYELTWDKLRRKGNYDSLFAEGGADLRNNEYIVYQEKQATISYLIEIGG